MTVLITTDVGVAARALVAGGLVAIPTETVYGLGADADDEAAVRRIFEVKARPAGHPLIVHVATRATSTRGRPRSRRRPGAGCQPAGRGR